MYRYDEDFDFFLEEFGEPTQCQEVDKRVIEHYQTKLPEQLFKYWRELGWCAYGKGLVWMVNPAEYEGILSMWLSGTVFEHRDDLSVISRTAFGELSIWAKGKGVILKTNPHLNTVTYFSEREENNFTQEEENKYMRYYWSGLEHRFLDYEDDTDFNDTKFKHGLFNRALEKLGPLKADEIYGFKHHHYLGGKYFIENVEKYKLDVYYDIAKQIKDVEVIKI